MAIFWLKDPYVIVNSVVLSAKTTEVGIDLSRVELSPKAGGDEALRRMAGHKDWELVLKFDQDMAAGSVDATMFAAYDGGTGIVIGVRATTDDKAATNPEYTGTGIVFGYKPFGEPVGDVAIAETNIKCSDGTGMSRSTS